MNLNRAEDNLPALLDHLRSLDVQLWNQDGQLGFRAPSGVLTESLRQQLRRNRERVLEHLRAPSAPGLDAAAWLRVWQPRPQAERRLICMAHAGGSARFFRSWGDALPAHTELVAVQYPGREERINELLCADLPTLVEGIAEALAQTPALLGKPYALFGHSMGGAVAHELYLSLQERRLPLPDHLFLSACEAPSRRKPEAFHKACDQQLKDEVFRLGGTNAAMAESTELLDLVLPVIRSDYQAIETYRPAAGRPRLAAPVTVLTGDQFEELDLNDALAWAEETHGTFAHRMFPGGHFYLMEHLQAVLAVVEQATRPEAKAPDPGHVLPNRVVTGGAESAQ